MRSLGRLEPVHVILRRVDALVLRPARAASPTPSSACPAWSRRRGRARCRSSTRSAASVLENPALMAFLPRLSEHLLGPAAARCRACPTWWCGEEDGPPRTCWPTSSRLVAAPDLAHRRRRRSVLGWELSAAELDDLRRRIEAEPLALGRAGAAGRWRARRPSPPTASQPRRSVLRAFAVAAERLLRGDARRADPGGARDGAGARISNQAGAISKDTWVLASEPERLTGFWLQLGPGGRGDRPDGLDPVAGGREPVVARPLRRAGRGDRPGCCARSTTGATTSRAAPTRPGIDVAAGAARRLTADDRRPTRASSATAPSSGSTSPGRELLDSSSTSSGPGTLAHAVRALLDAAYAVRDQLSRRHLAGGRRARARDPRARAGRCTIPQARRRRARCSG